MILLKDAIWIIYAIGFSMMILDNNRDKKASITIIYVSFSILLLSGRRFIVRFIRLREKWIQYS